MKLTYRGQAYETSTPAIEATVTGENGTFLGKPYALKQFNVAQRLSAEELTYRGTRYTR